MEPTPLRHLALGLGLLALLSGAAPGLRAQTPAPAQPPATPPAPSPENAAPSLSFEEYEPRSTLVVPEHPLVRARYPFIDVHNHQQSDSMSAEEVDRLVADMDQLNMAVMVNLSGGSGELFRQRLARLRERHPQRFLQFANVDFDKIDEPGFGEAAARQLEADMRAGARGLKIFKNLGMFVEGRRRAGAFPTDDPRLDPIWAKAGELGIPVLIHTGEPAAFWQPQDHYNERWLELNRDPRPPARLPRVRPVGADPERAAQPLPQAPEDDVHQRPPRLARQRSGPARPAARRAAEHVHRDRRGARRARPPAARRPRLPDQAPGPRAVRQGHLGAGGVPAYFRVLETADEYFPYYRRRHAFWKLYGLDLPDEVLRKLYYENALRIIPGIDRSLFPN